MKIILLLLPVLLAAQSPQFPNNVATDAQLKVAGNNIVTRNPQPVALGDMVILLANVTGIVPQMLLTIDSEAMSVVSIAGNFVTVLRGYDSTVQAAHLANRTVSANVTAWYHNAMRAEVEAIEGTLGANLVNIVNPPASAGIYTFTAAPGGSLTAGIVNTVTFPAGVRGINGTDTGHYIYLSNGTGTPEAVLITGGTYTSGGSGTITFTPAFNHSGAWTATSATGGAQEAVCVLPSTGGTVNISGSSTLLANVSGCGKVNVSTLISPGAVITGAFTIFGVPYAPNTATNQIISTGTAGFSSANLGNFSSTGTNSYSFVATSNGEDIATGTVHDEHGAIQYQIALAGATSVPAASTALEADAVLGSISGGSVVTNPVALSGHCRIAIDGISGVSPANRARCWGINTLVTDQNTGTNSGHNHAYLTNEYDFNINGPDTQVYGSSVGGNSTVQPAAAVGYLLNSLGSGIFWNTGFACIDNSATVCFGAGLAGTGNNVGSMSFAMSSRQTSGAVVTSTVASDGAGDLVLTGGDGTVIAQGNFLAGASLQSPVVQATGVVKYPSYTVATLPSAYLGVAGAAVWASNATTAGTCVGGGTGHLAVSNGTSWTCQ